MHHVTITHTHFLWKTNLSTQISFKAGEEEDYLGNVEGDREEEDGGEVLEESLLNLARIVHGHVVVDRVVNRDIPAKGRKEGSHIS